MDASEIQDNGIGNTIPQQCWLSSPTTLLLSEVQYFPIVLRKKKYIYIYQSSVHPLCVCVCVLSDIISFILERKQWCDIWQV